MSIATPINDKVVEIVKAIQDQKYEFRSENLGMFEIPKL